MGYCSQSDLEAVVGGPKPLAQLLDKDGDGLADPALVAKAIAAGASQLNTAIQVQVEPSSITVPYEQVLIDNNAVLAAEWAHQFGSGGVEVPPWLTQAANRVREWMSLFVDRKRTLGASPQRGSSQLLTQVVKSDTEDFVSQSSPRRRFDGWA